MKVRDLIKLEIYVDITTNVFIDLYCAFSGPQPLTKFGLSYWEDVLDLDCELSDEATVCEIIIPDILNEKETKEINEIIKDFLAAVPGIVQYKIMNHGLIKPDPGQGTDPVP